MNTTPFPATLFLGSAIAIMAMSCSSCNAIRSCFNGGGATETSGTCGQCGSTSCSTSCSANHATTSTEGKLVHSCALDADAQHERAARLKETVFVKAIATKEIPEGYAILFREPDAFTRELEEIAAFERKCCASFNWSVVTGEGTQELRVTGAGAQAEIGGALRKLGWMQ